MFECGLFHDGNGYLCKSECRSLHVARLKKAIRYDHVRIQEFFLGRGGGGVRSIRHKKKSSDNVFFLFFFYFLVLNLFYRIPVVTFKENYHFPRFQWGWTIFLGSNFFRMGGGGSNCLFPIETHITCDFPGSGPPASPTPSGSAHVIPCIVV